MNIRFLYPLILNNKMRTRIIITIGPASEKPRVLKEIISAGADIIRINLKYSPIDKSKKIRKKIINSGNAKILVDIKKREKIKQLIDKKFDYLAISFAEDSMEIEKIRNMFSRKIKIISKIETKKGVAKFEKVPMIQKMINKKCNRKKIISITATEMMPSMTKYKRPSRAEVTDVANAILEGSEFLLLAEETAVGRYPILSVKNMKKIINETEKHIREFR